MKRRLRIAVRLPRYPALEDWGRRGRLVFLLIFALVVSLGVRSVFGERGVVEWWRLRAEASGLEAEVADLRESLAREVDTAHELRDGGELVERLARERLGMARPGEVVYLVLNDGEPGRWGTIQGERQP